MHDRRCDEQTAVGRLLSPWVSCLRPDHVNPTAEISGGWERRGNRSNSYMDMKKAIKLPISPKIMSHYLLCLLLLERVQEESRHWYLFTMKDNNLVYLPQCFVPGMRCRGLADLMTPLTLSLSFFVSHMQSGTGKPTQQRCSNGTKSHLPRQ